MAQLEIPKLAFNGWRKWSARPRPSQNFEVPLEFGILGLYLLAEAEGIPGDDLAPNSENLPEEVLYVGMSTHVDRRLERTHNAVTRFADSKGANMNNLWFAVWQSEWTNTNLKQSRGIIALATLAVYERALILAYARKFGRLPNLNRI